MSLRRRVICIGALALVGLLTAASSALAGSLAPQLRLPRRGHTVSAGHIRLVAYIPHPENAVNGEIFLELSDKRIVRRGLLYSSRHCGSRCDIATMKRVRGHPHRYVYADRYQFPGLWQDTPGTYYWQVYYYPKGALGLLASRVGCFHVW